MFSKMFVWFGGLGVRRVRYIHVSSFLKFEYCFLMFEKFVDQ